MSSTLTTKKLDYIDALRGLAIIGVIMVHSSQYGTIHIAGTLENLLNNGARGVQLFFLVSAFTLFLSFKKHIEKETSPTRNFFIRRFFRIAPMYYLGICYYLFQNGMGTKSILGGEVYVGILSVLSNIVFLHAFNPYWIEGVVPGGWSIGVEMTFYLILPFLFSRIKNINQAFLFFIISLSVNYLLQLHLYNHTPLGSRALWCSYLFLFFPSQLPVFALGILMYFFVYDFPAITNLSGKLLLFLVVILLKQLGSGTSFIISNWVLFVIGLSMLVKQINTTYLIYLLLGMILIRVSPDIISNYDFMLPSHILFGITFLILGIALSVYRFKLLVNPIINYLGKISFSLYLVHFAVLYWLTHFNFIDYFANPILNYATRFLIVTSLAALLSTFFYRIIEIPFQKFGKNIIDRLENKTQVPLT